MPRQSTPKKNLRRCKTCGAAGHNKATCLIGRQACSTVSNTTQTPAKQSAGLKFFVHHVQGPSAYSPHIVNLKNENNPWQKIESVAPTVSSNPLFHFHHEATPQDAAVFAQTVHLNSQNQEPLSVNLSTSLTSQLLNQPNKLINYFSNTISKIQSTTIAIISAAKNLRRFSWPKLLHYEIAGGVIAIIIIFTLPRAALSYYENLHSTVSELATLSTVGFKNLSQSMNALLKGDIERAKNYNNQALTDLGTAGQMLKTKHTVLQTLALNLPIIGGKVESGQQLFLAAEELAVGNSQLLNNLPDFNASSSASERLGAASAALKLAVPHYRAASNHLADVKTEIVPSSYQADLLLAKRLLEAATTDLENLIKTENALSDIFGKNGERLYLLVFQNEHEIRPTGGFMGSFAIAKIKDGKLISLEVPPGGSYDLQGQLDTYVEPPAPLSLSNKRWEFQDANWFPDFSTSAEKILWFYRHSRNISADGVIAINSSVLEPLLTLTGPISLPNRGLTLTAADALFSLQSIIETGPEKKLNRPKQVLADAAPLFINYFSNLTSANSLPLLVSLSDALEQKEIQAYFTDQAAENLVSQYGWAGKIISTAQNQDFLYVVDANIQGAKSDFNIKQKISHQAVIDGEGNIINTVEITREHQGSASDSLYDATNIDYLRLYVPTGSVLLSASGFSWPDEKLFRVPDAWAKPDALLTATEQEVGVDQRTGTRITKEFGKYAFGNWVITAPGEVSHIQFTYKLPFKALESNAQTSFTDNNPLLAAALPRTGRYQLVVQKQSGVESSFESQIVLPPFWHPAWHDGQNAVAADNGLTVNLPSLNNDSVWSVAFKNK